MSTEHQQYSTENQADVIKAYAKNRGMQIVRTYADEGKSGLMLSGRAALQKLIDDVESGRADFKAILVYDVSRWGRFQDTDESAYYEYICKRAGINVRYCAEQFENNGSISSTIFKSVKRAMAGEYSRELSAKVFRGQCRLIELGYRQGGPAGYGLRRMLVDMHGDHKGILARGEHKSLQTDRVILVPGPAEEVKTVRWIYRMFNEEGKQEAAIAEILNRKGIRTDLGRRWTRGTVHQVVTNEKYMGNNVYNRRSFKLKQKRVINPPEMWIRAERVFDPIIDPETFYVSRGIIRERSRRLTDEEMIERLKGIYRKFGKLSGLLIDESEGIPSSTVYRSRFGSLIRTYRLVGYTPERDYRYIEINRFLRQLYPELVGDVIQKLKDLPATVEQDDRTDLLNINDEYTVSVVICRCRQTTAGSLRWLIRMDQSLAPDVTIAVRMDSANHQPNDYYLLPRIDIMVEELRLAEMNGIYLDTYRFDTLDFLFSMAMRATLPRVA